MRHGELSKELEACGRDQAVRVVLLTAPRGAGTSGTLQAFVEELRGRGLRADLTDTERVGVQPGGALESLLRARLGLDPGAHGHRVLEALERASPGLEPQARELLAHALGLAREDFRAARLDEASRWEGAVAEAAQLLCAGAGPWAWLLDDALSLDEPSLQLIVTLAQGAATPGLVVLAVRDDERGVFEPRLRALRSSGRLQERALAPLPEDALAAAFPQTAAAARGNLLAARLLEASGRAGPPLALEALVRELVAALPGEQRAVLAVLALAGGRLPEAALEVALGLPQPAALAALEHRLLVRRGPTARCGGAQEVWLRFPAQAPTPEPAAAGHWLAALGGWAERQVLEPKGGALRALALPLVIRAAEAGGEVHRASLAWELSAREGAPGYGLQQAQAGARGVRRLVLLRLHAEDALFRGEAQRAAASAASGARLPGAAEARLPEAWKEAALRGVTDELARWDRLTQEEAQLALELTALEARGQLGQAQELRRALERFQQRLAKAPATPATHALWLRAARTWVWLAQELLADGPLARRACDTARARVPASALASSSYGPAFLRAEQAAHARGGDPARARALAEELVQLARARGDQREECMALDARALLHLREGALRQARAGFERSLTLARGLGFRRGEAVALHRLGLTLALAGEWGAARSCQERYLLLSEQIGDRVARAFGPAALALVHVQQVETRLAEAELTRARREAEENGWPGLLAWIRHLSGTLKLLRHLQQPDTLLLSLARADFLACLDLLEDRKGGWSEALDPAETAAFLSLTWLCAGNAARAEAALPQVERYQAQSAVSGQVAGALRDVLAGRPPAASAAWFEANGQYRALELWQRVAAHFELPLEAGATEVRAEL